VKGGYTRYPCEGWVYGTLAKEKDLRLSRRLFWGWGVHIKAKKADRQPPGHSLGPKRSLPRCPPRHPCLKGTKEEDPIVKLVSNESLDFASEALDKSVEAVGPRPSRRPPPKSRSMIRMTSRKTSSIPSRKQSIAICVAKKTDL
jgi:hypothetical protein